MPIQLVPKFKANYDIGDIYFTRVRGDFISDGIAYFEYGFSGEEVDEWTHCGVCVSETVGIGAHLVGGIQEEDLGKMFKDRRTRITFMRPVLFRYKNPNDLVSVMVRRLGEKYDWNLIVGLLIVNSWFGKRYLSDRIKKEILRIFNASGRAICSEVLAEELYHVGLCFDSFFRKTPAELSRCLCLSPVQPAGYLKKV